MRTDEVGRCSFLPTQISNEIALAVGRDLGANHPTLVAIEVQKATDVDDVDMYFVERQIREILKKFKDPTKKDDTLARVAYNKFEAVCGHLRTFDNLEFPVPGRFYSWRCDSQALLLLRARSLIHEILGGIDFSELVLAARNSGGTTQGVSFFDTSDVAKFSYPITATTSQLRIFRAFLQADVQLHDAIVRLNGGKPLQFEIVSGSRATTVPKSDTTDRMIAIETTVGMFLQQAVMNVFVRRLKDFGLDLARLPDLHQSLAKLYSVTREGATVDFASASDCVLYKLVRFLFRSDWFYLLDSLRSTSISYEIDGEEKVIDMPMFSTMGNATTFPIETLVFYALAHVCSSPDTSNSQLSGMEKLSSVSVFGDDCILPTTYAEHFISLCESVGFMVNKDKSFYSWESAFRESCGGDFLHGRNVRPVYIGEPTGSRVSDLESWLYIIWNNFLKKYMSYFGSLTYIYRSELFSLLLDLMRTFGIKPNVVPSTFPDDSGLYLLEDLDRWIANYGNVFHLPEVSKHGSLLVNYQRWTWIDDTATPPRDPRNGKRKPSKRAVEKYEHDLKVFRKRRKLSDQIRYREFLRKGVWTDIHLIERGSDYLRARRWANASTKQFVACIDMFDAPDPFDVYKRKRKGGYVVAKAVYFDELRPNFKGYIEFLERIL